MTDRAAGIIISKRHILLIHRVRAKREYYAFPGGHVEEGESAEEACIREIREETGLETAWLEFAFDYTIPARSVHYFFVEPLPGTLALTGPELEKQSAENRYLPEWVPLIKLGEIDLQPIAMQKALIRLTAEIGPAREARDLALRRERLQALLLKE